LVASKNFSSSSTARARRCRMSKSADSSVINLTQGGSPQSR
jgi:hypothetical protein